MAHDTSLAGITIPDGDDTADVVAVMAAAVSDIETKLVIPMTHADRAGMATPPDGTVVYETDTGETWQHHGADVWRYILDFDPDNTTWDLPSIPWSAPWGKIDRRTDANNRNGFVVATAKIHANLDSTQTYPGGRAIKLTAHANLAPAIGVPSLILWVYKDGSPLGRAWQFNNAPAGSVFSFSGEVYDEPAAGSHTYGLYLEVANSSTTANVNGGADTTTLLIEDIGPA